MKLDAHDRVAVSRPAALIRYSAGGAAWDLLIVTEGARLERWIDSLTGSGQQAARS